MRFSDAVVLTVTTSFITYLIFKRFEPDRLIPVGFLLVFVPSCLVPVIHLHVRNIILAVVTTFTSHYALILLYVALYRLSPFHPLAQYPGPIKNKLSKFTSSYIAAKGKQHVYVRKLHERYGDIVRTGPNEISVNRADTVQPVLGAGGLPKGHWWYNRGPSGQQPAIIAQRDPVEHKRRRRTWDRAFSSAAIKNYDVIVIKKVRELMEQFEKRAGQEIDLSMWMTYFSYDFMGHMAFGTGFDMVRTGADVNGVWTTLEKTLSITTVVAHVPWIFTYLRLLPGAAKRRDRSFAIAAEYVSRRVKEGANVKDLYYHLTDEEGLEPVKPSREIVYSDGLLAVIAGSDTTATTLTGLWYYLLGDPERFERLRNEVDTYFPPGEEPLDFTRMVNMPYLNACINETLRLLPPTLQGSLRCTPPGSGGKLMGPYFIPEGTQVFNHLFTLHRNPLHFSPYPDSFLPERWLPEPERRKFFANSNYILDLTAFNPFSYGPANCVGKNLALLELRAVTCFVAQRFNFKAKNGFKLESWEEDIEDFVVLKRPPLPVIVEMRK